MFFEILFLALLLAVILVRVLISIKMATEHAAAHWNQVKIVTTLSKNETLREPNGSRAAFPPRRSARIQANKTKLSLKTI